MVLRFKQVQVLLVELGGHRHRQVLALEMLQLQLEPGLFGVRIRNVEADWWALHLLPGDVDQTGAEQGIHPGQGMDERWD